MIDNTQLIEILASRLACGPALKWLGKRNSDEMWTQCERPKWLLWWVALYVPRTELVLVVCQCARLALPHVAAGELRPLRAIETAEGWTRGEVKLEKVRTAANAADYAAFVAARADDRAAHAAAIAAASAADVAQAADAADAADRASLTAHAAVIAAVEAAASVDRAAVQAQMCELIREQWPICPEPGVER